MFKKLFNAKVITTTDHDKEIRWRFAFKDPLGGYRARAIMGWVELREDGACDTKNHTYVEKWRAV